MKLLIVLCVVAAASAAPPTFRGNYKYRPDNVEVFESVPYENSGYGPYRYAYLLSDGSSRSEEAIVRNEGQSNQFLEITGYYTFIAPNNVKYTVNYKADENGNQQSTEQGPGYSLDFAAGALG